MRQNSEVNGLGFSVGSTVRRRATDIMERGTAATQAEPIDFAADQPLGPPPAAHYQLLPIRQELYEMRRCAQASQRSTCPPSAAVRQCSIADMTFSWPRLTWPAWDARQAGPRLPKMS